MPAFAANNWPGWDCTDLTILDEAIASISDLDSRVTVKVLKQSVVSKVSTYEELCQTIDSVVDAENGLTENQKKEKKIILKKQIPLCKRIFLQEAWNYCKANPSFYDLFYYISVGKKLGLSDTEVYNNIVNLLLQNQTYAHAVKTGVSKMIDLGINIDVDAGTQKENLQKLNRKYSRQLLVNKTEWEPVIALIRTAIDSF